MEIDTDAQIATNDLLILLSISLIATEIKDMSYKNIILYLDLLC